MAKWTEIRWDDEGRPYHENLQADARTRVGERMYVSPSSVSTNPAYADQRLREWSAANQAPRGGFFKGSGQWRGDEGWKQPINWGNIAALGVGGAIAAPFVVPALASLGGAGGGAGTLASSSVPVSSASALPAAITSGAASAVPASTLIAAAPATMTAATAIPASITSQGISAGIGAAGGGGGGGGGAGLLSGALTTRDLVGLGAAGVGSYMDYRAQRQAAAADERAATEAERAARVQEAATAEALAFARQQYADQTAREQARWDATEARRVPYRQASLGSLAELKKLIGI